MWILAVFNLISVMAFAQWQPPVMLPMGQPQPYQQFQQPYLPSPLLGRPNPFPMAYYGPMFQTPMQRPMYPWQLQQQQWSQYAQWQQQQQLQQQQNFLPWAQQNQGLNLGFNFDLSSLFGGGSNSDPFSLGGGARRRRDYDDDYCERCEERRRRPERIIIDDEEDRPAPRRRLIEREDNDTEAAVVGVNRTPRERELEPSRAATPAPRSALPPTGAAVPARTLEPAPSAEITTDTPIPEPSDMGDDRVAGAELNSGAAVTVPRAEVARPVTRAPSAPVARPAPAPTTRPGMSATEPDRLTRQERYYVAMHGKDERNAQESTLWDTFIDNFKSCGRQMRLGDCSPLGYSAFGKRNHADGTPKFSCHNKGLAIDIRGMKCSGQVYWATHGERETHRMVACMRTRMDHVLYQNGSDPTLGHNNNIHFTNGCWKPGPPGHKPTRYW